MTHGRKARTLGPGESAVRVAVFGTGKLGKEIIRRSVNLETVDVVAAAVVDPRKEGMDGGEIAGVGKLGIPATTRIETLVARDDIESIIFAGIGSPDEQLEILGRFLDVGKDAITTNGLVHPISVLGAAEAEELDDRARLGGARMVGTGWNPGFILDVLPVTWGSACTKIDHLYALRIGEACEWGPAILDMCRFGHSPEESPPELPVLMSEKLNLLGDGLGIVFDSIENFHEPYISPTRREYAGRIVQPGTTAGFRKRAVGYRENVEVAEIEWQAIFCIDPAVDGVEEAVRLRIVGDTSIEAEASGNFFGDPTGATAGRALNIVVPLRTLAPGLYRPDQVPVSR